jgi:DNA-binding NarL/FixJ family response regulator
MAIAGLRLVLAGGIYVPPSEPNSQQQDHPKIFQVDDQHATESARPCTGELIAARHLAAPDSAESRSRFTSREADVLRELVRGRSNKIIAAELGVSENTVKMHIQHIMRKLKVTNRTEAVISWNRASQRSPVGIQIAY